MRHFDYLTANEKDAIFYKQPEVILKTDSKDLLSHALGAALYMPAVRPGIAEDLISGKHEGLKSVVICLEDAVDDNALMIAEHMLAEQMELLYEAVQNEVISSEELPFLFIRIRNPTHLLSAARLMGQAISLLTGFVLPKFTHANGTDYLENLAWLNRTHGLHLFAMPILESPEVIYQETRQDALWQIKTLLDSHYEQILNIRIGGTDFSGLYGLRRSAETTIYDIAVIRDCIADIINLFGRGEKEYVISGPVWEYFYNGSRILKPKLRKTPFEEQYGGSGIGIREEMLNHYIDGLIQEVLLDKANGITGKTIIHPTHIKPVQSLCVVEYEEYMDAQAIVDSAEHNNGVISSAFSNKMNEIKPHYNWAKKTLLKSKAFGVYHDDQNFISILSERTHVSDLR